MESFNYMPRRSIQGSYDFLSHLHTDFHSGHIIYIPISMDLFLVSILCLFS